MTPGLPFTKMQAVGNDFVVIEEAVWGVDTDYAQTAIRLCDRHKGVGGDGLLVVCPSEVADVRMRMFNPDGTEDMCGNGLRCVVRHIVDATVCPAIGKAQTLGGVISYQVENDSITTVHPPPSFAPARIPMNIPDTGRITLFPLVPSSGETVWVSSLNTGSTHTIIWSDSYSPPDEETFLRISPMVETHSLFPERTSVIWAFQQEPDSVHINIWERGVGETLGCGTGAMAVVVAGIEEKRFLSPQVTVWSKGGKLSVIYDKTQFVGRDNLPTIRLIGEAHTVYSGVVSPAV